MQSFNNVMTYEQIQGGSEIHFPVLIEVFDVSQKVNEPHSPHCSFKQLGDEVGGSSFSEVADVDESITIFFKHILRRKNNVNRKKETNFSSP